MHNTELKKETLASPSASNRKHFYELDSLRGLAASVVIVYHWQHLWPVTSVPRWLDVLIKVTPLQLLTSGHSSVILFFVLSGFVLSLPQLRGQPIHYFSYLIKRVCRIYVPYVAALCLAITGCYLFHGLIAYDGWFTLTWKTAPTSDLIWRHVLFLGDYDTAAYNTAFWSLVYEMRISLIFPFLCAIALRGRLLGLLASSALLAAVPAFVGHYGAIPHTYLLTCTYTGFFVLGILSARLLECMTLWLRSQPPLQYWGILILSLALYAYGPLAAYHLHWRDASADIIVATGASGLVIYSIVDKRLCWLLLLPPVRFLGKISYSLYLIHGTVLFCFAYIFHDKVSPLIWFIPYVLVTVLSATILWRVVESPSMRLGRTISDVIGTKRAARSAAAVEVPT